MPSNSSFIEELRSAARGSIALLTGDRAAPSYFDLSTRGLYGSIIAFLLVTAFNTFFPALLGFRPESGSVTLSFVLLIGLYVIQVAFGALVLRQLKRLDGLVPYIVADNWMTFFVTLLSTGLLLAGIGGEAVFWILVLLVLVVEINIARLIVTLSPLQIAMFIIAQVVGGLIGYFIIGMIVPLPEVAAELAATASSQ